MTRGTADLENPFVLPLPGWEQGASSELRLLEASTLAVRLINAQGITNLELEAEVGCDISLFVCHMAREVEEGELSEAEFDFYTERFSELLNP